MVEVRSDLMKQRLKQEGLNVFGTVFRVSMYCLYFLYKVLEVHEKSDLVRALVHKKQFDKSS